MRVGRVTSDVEWMKKKLVSIVGQGRGGLAQQTKRMTIAYVVGYGAQGLYFLALARELGPSGLGTFAGCLAIVSVIAPFSGLGSGQILLRDTSRDPGRFRGRLWQALAAIGGTGALATLVMSGAAIAFLHQTEFAATLVALSVSELIFGRINDLSAQSFQAHDEVGRAGIVTAGVSVGRLGMIAVWLAVPIHRTAESWSDFYLLASAVCALVALGAVAARHGTPTRARSRLSDFVGAGLSFSIGTASKTVYADIDKAMLSQMNRVAAAGIYTAAYRIVYMAYAPVLAFLYSSNTRFFRAGTSGAGSVWAVARRGLPAACAYGLCAGVGLLALSPLMPVLLGARYHAAASAVRWLCGLPLIMGAHSMLGDAMMGMGRQALRSMLQVGTAILNVGLNVWLIPLASWRGATYATYACEGLLALALLITLRAQVRNEGVSQSSDDAGGGEQGSLGHPRTALRVAP